MDILEYENTQEIKTHGNLNFPFNIYPCSIPLDFPGVPVHWHNDMEIIYVKKGSGVISVDLLPFQVQAGDIVFIVPGQLHEIAQAEDCSMEYENIIFQLSMMMPSNDDLCSDHFFTPLLHGQLFLPPCLSVSDSVYPDIARCLDEIDQLSSRGDSYSTLGIKGKLFELFYTLFSHYKDARPSRPGSQSLDTVKIIVKHVETHYQEDISIETMAALCHFSASHFMKFFKQHMGTPFTAYLNDYRLTMAARLLSASSDAVVNIASETGFDNLSYFNRLFKRKYGVTPTQYRRGSAASGL